MGHYIGDDLASLSAQDLSNLEQQMEFSILCLTLNAKFSLKLSFVLLICWIGDVRCSVSVAYLVYTIPFLMYNRLISG
jgi:hypothetical protein